MKSIPAAQAKTVGRGELTQRHGQLARQLAELQWDLGGLVDEMAIRDHFRLDVVVAQAARLQAVDAELGAVERMVRWRTPAPPGPAPRAERFTLAEPCSAGSAATTWSSRQRSQLRPSSQPPTPRLSSPQQRRRRSPPPTCRRRRSPRRFLTPLWSRHRWEPGARPVRQSAGAPPRGGAAQQPANGHRVAVDELCHEAAYGPAMDCSPVGDRDRLRPLHRRRNRTRGVGDIRERPDGDRAARAALRLG